MRFGLGRAGWVDVLGWNKGLKVPRFDVTGDALTGCAFQKARERMLIKARALWDELDKSDAQRYELTPTTE